MLPVEGDGNGRERVPYSVAHASSMSARNAFFSRAYESSPPEK
jgi:hypothetical protein